MAALLLATLVAGGCNRAPAPGAAPAQSSAPEQAPTAAATTQVAAQVTVDGHGSGPAWRELSAQQRRALVPLAADWARLSDVQRRNWLAMAEHFDTLSPDEKQKLQGRMAEWISLSPQQRAQARLNFGEAQRLAPDDKKAKWEAYQALTPEERRQLAKNAQPRPPATAAPVRPVAPDKLVVLPRGSQTESRPPRIVLSAPEGPAGHAPSHATSPAPAATPAPPPAPAAPGLGPAPGDVEAP